MGDGTTAGDVVRLARHRRRHLHELDPEARQLLQLVAAELQVPTEMLLAPSRGRAAFAHARQLAMYLCYVALGRRLATVGQLFGRDRSTVSHACARIEDMRDVRAFDDMVTRLEEAIAVPPQLVSQPEERIRAAG